MKRVNKLFWVCLAIGLLIAITGCGSSAPITRIHDPNVPEEHTVTLILPAGDIGFEVTHLDGEKLRSAWFMPTYKTSVFVKIPSVIERTGEDPGDRSFLYNAYTTSIRAEGISSGLLMTKAGRIYQLFGFNAHSTSAAFRVYEMPQIAEPDSEEQVIYIKNPTDFDLLVNLNTGKRSEIPGMSWDDSRVFYVKKGGEEQRFIVPKGENTITIAGIVVEVKVLGSVYRNMTPTGYFDAGRITTFTASTDTVRFSVVNDGNLLAFSQE